MALFSKKVSGLEIKGTGQALNVQDASVSPTFNVLDERQRCWAGCKVPRQVGYKRARTMLPTSIRRVSKCLAHNSQKSSLSVRKA